MTFINTDTGEVHDCPMEEDYYDGKSLHQKILAVQQAAESINKSGYNAFHKYSYAAEADVLAVKKLMNEHGLIAVPTLLDFTTEMRGDSLVVLQKIQYTIIDTVSGESIQCVVLGAGEDRGDKGAYKAATGGNKYFYLKFFGVPTHDDPENDHGNPKPYPDRNNQNRKNVPNQGKQGPPHPDRIHHHHRRERRRQGRHPTTTSSGQ